MSAALKCYAVCFLNKAGNPVMGISCFSSTSLTIFAPNPRPSAAGASASLAVVNYSDGIADGHLPLSSLRGYTLPNPSEEAATTRPMLVFRDLLSDVSYVRSSDTVLSGEGLWVQLQPWQAHVFDVSMAKGQDGSE